MEGNRRPFTIGMVMAVLGRSHVLSRPATESPGATGSRGSTDRAVKWQGWACGPHRPGSLLLSQGWQRKAELKCPSGTPLL